MAEPIRVPSSWLVTPLFNWRLALTAKLMPADNLPEARVTAAAVRSSGLLPVRLQMLTSTTPNTRATIPAIFSGSITEDEYAAPGSLVMCREAVGRKCTTDVAEKHTDKVVFDRFALEEQFPVPHHNRVFYTPRATIISCRHVLCTV